MDLDDLKKKLSQKDDSIENRPQPPADFELGRSSPQKQTSTVWNQEEKSLTGQWLTELLATVNRYKIYVSIVTALVLLGVAGFFIWRFFSFDRTSVALNIFGSEQAVSGEVINYIVHYKNNTRSVLKNVRLDFSFPTGSASIDEITVIRQGENNLISQNLAIIEPGQEAQVTFRLRLLGEKDSQ